MIPRLDAKAIAARDPRTMAALREGAEEIGFLTVHNTAISSVEVLRVLAAYRRFFRQPEAKKRAVDMALTGANRGWGASGSEQVDPRANPDYKQIFDCGFELEPDDPLRDLGRSVYADNLWPDNMPEFRGRVRAYYGAALAVSFELLQGIAVAIGQPEGSFDRAFERPMALLRGNFYPSRPRWATKRDFGIATHTDYGCLTLLATDGTPGLEVRARGGGWIPVSAPPGEFIINFGEMLEMWSGRKVRATPHRVVGGDAERISVPMFFNPSYDTNVAPIGSGETVLVGDHLKKRFDETYLHLQKKIG